MSIVNIIANIFSFAKNTSETEDIYSNGIKWYPGIEHGNPPPFSSDSHQIHTKINKIDNTETTKKQSDWSVKSFDIPETEGKVRFHDLNLSNELMHALSDLNFKYCTPIQGLTLKDSIAGADILGKAQTGTGKTAAFLISIISRLLESDSCKRTDSPRALILAPTRELVLQIEQDAKKLLKYMNNVRILSLYGGTEYSKQKDKFNKCDPDIVVATPGRLLDFQKRQDIQLNRIETLVIDEADRMLDMGFIPDVRQIVYSTPHKDRRQTLFFSATMTDDVNRLAAQWTRNPVIAETEPEQVAVDSVDQKIYIITEQEKLKFLLKILSEATTEKVIIFANMRSKVRNLHEQLIKNGIDCDILSGEVSQNRRISTLKNFKNGNKKVLVATDVAGRGLHIDDISHVINFTLPENPEDYVHRIGRTGRAGKNGISISFACEEDSFYIPAIEEYLGEKLNCEYPEI
ncbi:MAG: DEAD/DEAH box helicase [Gammaproteobacteria bacterium]|nr:MAG: DEAD/DEAH box helicase [Gammaproteobacteria bacterium]